MKILIASDKFKGSLSAEEVCQNIEMVLRRRFPTSEIISCPMADGGDGSLEILSYYLPLEKRSCKAKDPLGRAMQASYFVAESAAFIELANTSGLVLLNAAERNPLLTSTEGTGILIKNAIENGAKEILLFLGGSATNDAGMGIAKALGFQLKDQENKDLEPIGGNLSKIAKIIPSDYSKLQHVAFTILCDVTNPMFGPTGAAHVFAKQKGADAEQIELLDRGLQHLSQILIAQYGKDVSQLTGGGAAGGIGAGLCALMKAEMKNGFKFMADITQLNEKIQQANFVITGEGRLDKQSLGGKVISGVNDLCRQNHKPMIVVAGKNELSPKELSGNNILQLHTISDLANDAGDAMQNAAEYIRRIAENMKF